MNADQIELPPHAHLPGRNGRHTDGFLDHVISLAPHLTISDEASKNVPWLYGTRLFKSGFFWEAHEVWEAVWLRATPNSREQHFMQGMIHLTNASLKLKLDQQRAGAKILVMAEQSFERAFQGRSNKAVMGISSTDVRVLLKKIGNM